MKIEGQIRKMVAEVDDKGQVSYQLPLSDKKVPLNQFLGEKIHLKYSGNIFCVDTGKKISKSYNGGYSYESFITKAACDVCIVQPEKCHYHKGTCREPEWGERECFQDHYVYLAITSGVKVGMTRSSQIPTRWVDQGASYALPILKTKNRLIAGLIEHEMKGDLSDKTHWKRMLQEKPEFQDLKKIQKDLIKKHQKMITEMEAEVMSGPINEFHYPMNNRPEKFKSIGFDKENDISGTLQGIKGQYLLFDDFVINIRKHGGYEIELESNK